MASLLKKAIQIRDRLSVQADLEEIPLAERDRILSEIENFVSVGKDEVRDDTLSFTSLKNDNKLPIIINFSALAIVIILGLFFLFYFNQAETDIVSHGENINGTENKVIQALRAESAEKLKEKENEINRFRVTLDEMKLDQQRLLSESRDRVETLELELRQQILSDLEEERARLNNEGLSNEDIETRVSDLAADKEREFQQEMSRIMAEVENERIEWENSYRDQVSAIENNLQKAQTEKERLEASQKKLADEQNQFETEMAQFSEMREQEELVTQRIAALYSEIRTLMETGRAEMAEESLSELEELINNDRFKNLPSILYRRELDLFMIDSLRRLNQKDDDQVRQLLPFISEMVAQGNRFYNSGAYQSARDSYLKAIKQIPSLETGYSRLESLNELEKEEDREYSATLIREGDRLFKAGDFNGAIGKYKEAMASVDSGNRDFSRIIETIVSFYENLVPSDNQELISTDDLFLMNQAKNRLEYQQQLIDNIQQIKGNLENLAGNTSVSEKDETVSLLNSKLQIRELLSSDSIREIYPDLNSSLDEFLKAFGEDKANEGRMAALETIVNLTSDLEENSPVAANEEERLLYIQLLNNLTDLIKNPES